MQEDGEHWGLTANMWALVCFLFQAQLVMMRRRKNDNFLSFFLFKYLFGCTGS